MTLEHLHRCTHEGVRFPERPVLDAWYVCPDCGEKVGQRGGRIITVRENNEIAHRQDAAFQRDRLAEYLRDLGYDDFVADVLAGREV